MSRDSRRRISVVGLALAIALVPALAFASHGDEGFEDVPDDHTFHDDIDWMHDTGVTRGCNPPENTEYCPERDLNRGEEAAFFHRYDNYLRDSLENRLLPEECEDAQIAEFNGETWECADQGTVTPPEDGLNLAPGDPTEILADDTPYEVTASCEEGQTAISGSVAPVTADLTVEGPTIENGMVTFQVTNAGAEPVAVTAYAICTTA